VQGTVLHTTEKKSSKNTIAEHKIGCRIRVSFFIGIHVTESASIKFSLTRRFWVANLQRLEEPSWIEDVIRYNILAHTFGA